MRTAEVLSVLKNPTGRQKAAANGYEEGIKIAHPFRALPLDGDGLDTVYGTGSSGKYTLVMESPERECLVFSHRAGSAGGSSPFYTGSSPAWYRAHRLHTAILP